MNIGFFDSGVGGLYVLRHTIEKLPQYHYVFLGDTVNVPYGDKTDEEIYTLTTEALKALFEHECRLVIFACNTASVTALRRIQDEFIPQYFPDRKVLGVIIPTVEEILVGSPQTVAIIATERTIRSGKYEREIHARNPHVNVVARATPSLVPLIEAGALEKALEEAAGIIRKELLPVSPDTLVLGCTHYGLLKETLRKRFPHLRILSQEEIIPEKLATYLARHPEIERELIRDSEREFYLTKITPFYRRTLQEWLGSAPLHLHTFHSSVE